MNAKKAASIIAVGVLPGEIDSIDLAKAKGFLEAVKGAEPLAEVASELSLESEQGQFEDHPLHDALFKKLKKALEKYKKEVLGGK